jgi:hypothetical protein
VHSSPYPGKSVLAAVAAILIVSAAWTVRGADGETFGAGVTVTTPTPLASIVARPSDFEGKTVRVDGVVTAVCEVAGCWMALAPSAEASTQALRFKVEDGVIVFPLRARGRRASAQGVVERIAGHDAHGREAAAEHAHQEKRHADPPASTLWHVRATGAIVY